MKENDILCKPRNWIHDLREKVATIDHRKAELDNGCTAQKGNEANVYNSSRKEKLLQRGMEDMHRNHYSPLCSYPLTLNQSRRPCMSLRRRSAVYSEA